MTLKLILNIMTYIYLQKLLDTNFILNFNYYLNSTYS